MRSIPPHATFQKSEFITPAMRSAHAALSKNPWRLCQFTRREKHFLTFKTNTKYAPTNNGNK